MLLSLSALLRVVESKRLSGSCGSEERDGHGMAGGTYMRVIFSTHVVSSASAQADNLGPLRRDLHRFSSAFALVRVLHVKLPVLK